MAPSQNPQEPTPTRVAQLRKGSRISGGVYLVQESNFKQTRNSKYFIQMVLRDRTGSIKAVRWEATREVFDSFGPDDFLEVHGRVEEFQQQLQVIVDDLRRVPPDQVSVDEFLPTSSRDLAEMERELLEVVAGVGDPSIRALLAAIVDDPQIRDALVRCPAGKALHHAYIGGLLEHVLSICGAAKLLARNYPSLNVDVLIAASILHDIGKTRELVFDRSFGYSDEGQLVGHVGIGLLLLTDKARTVPNFPQETLLHLQHIILSHHGIPEHGAIKQPMTAEAIAFHFLDNLDAKLAMVEHLRKELEVIEESTDRDTRWTEYKPALGRRIFFPE